MEPLTREESDFVARREKLIRYWPLTGGIALVSLLGFAAWLWRRVPLLIDPTEVMRRIQAEPTAEPIEEGTLLIAAAVLPWMTLACLFLLVALLVFMFVALRNEGRHIALIKKLTDANKDQQPATR